MWCLVCHKKISKTNVSELCIQCKSNKKITITTTDAKKIYKLTDKEINDAKLFCFSVNNSKKYGKRYFTDEIEDLAEKIYANIYCHDKRKQIYLDNIRDIYETIGIDKHEKFDTITDMAYAYLDKHNINLSIEMTNND